MSNPKRIPPEYNNKIPKWWKDFLSPKEPEKWVNKLPPLGNALLKHIIDHYGAEKVCKATYVFIELDKRKILLEQAKTKIEDMLESIIDITDKKE